MWIKFGPEVSQLKHLPRSEKDVNVSFLVMGYSTDSLPHIGQVPGKPGQFIIAGFTGHGMPQAWLSGKGVAAMVSEGIPFAQSGIPKLFETTQTRLEHTRNDILESMEDPNQPRSRL